MRLFGEGTGFQQGVELAASVGDFQPALVQGDQIGPHKDHYDPAHQRRGQRAFAGLDEMLIYLSKEPGLNGASLLERQDAQHQAGDRGLLEVTEEVFGKGFRGGRVGGFGNR